MRAYLDSILTFIGSATLTTEEWESLDLSETPTDLEVYQSLLVIINDRDLVSTDAERLTLYFQAKGLELTPPSQGKSNIFMGASLED